MNTITKTDAAAVWDALRGIPDPEFGINIVDLGLIYSVECNDGDIDVTMTLTTPSCPSGNWIHEGAKVALAHLPGVRNVNVAMVFDPMWTPEMLSESAQRQLGRID
jgi:metal-sulfur cluster biosynthetic enzyme